MLRLLALFGERFAAPPVSYAATMPGAGARRWPSSPSSLISCGLLLDGARCRAAPASRRTGLVAGALVALYIAFEAPLSGMSMNPARSFASAAPGGSVADLWIYFVAPPLGMLAAARAAQRCGARTRGCAKLVHAPDHRCIHCGHEPARRGAARHEH